MKRTHTVPKPIPSGAVPDVGPDNADRDDRRSFLRVDDIPAGGATVVFTGESRVIKGKFGDQWACVVRVGKKEYEWGIRIGASVHRGIQALAGKRIKPGFRVPVEVKEFTNRAGEQISYIALADEN